MVIISVHNSVLGHGPAPNLVKYLHKLKTDRLIYITHPLLFIRESYSLSSAIHYYSEGNLTDEKTAFHWRLPEILLYCKDFIYTCIWTLSLNAKVDVFFGFDNVNALSGLVLKRLGKVDKVIYYCIDYFPTRFANPLLNTLYHFIDKICVRFCDETWNASPQIAKARARKGMRGENFSRQYTVPMGIWYNEIKHSPHVLENRFRLFFIGTLMDYMGLDLVISAIPQLLKKYPEICLDIIGIGEEHDKLVQKVHVMKLDKYIHFHGLLTAGKKREYFFRNASIGLATFNTDILDEKVKNADPVKIKEYTAYGIPVIVTDAISNADEITRAGCGIVIPYRQDEFIRAVTQIFSDSKHYKQYRFKALEYAKQFDWESIFRTNVNRLHII